MIALRSVLTALLLVGFELVGAAHHAAAGEALTCLRRPERRAAVLSRQVLPLGRVLRMTRTRIVGEVIGARLCQSAGGGFVYLLTVLARDGKVTVMRLNADTGQYIGGR